MGILLISQGTDLPPPFTGEKQRVHQDDALERVNIRPRTFKHRHPVHFPRKLRGKEIYSILFYSILSCYLSPTMGEWQPVA
jgi:hypothetical protein